MQAVTTNSRPRNQGRACFDADDCLARPTIPGEIGVLAFEIIPMEAEGTQLYLLTHHVKFDTLLLSLCSYSSLLLLIPSNGVMS